MTFLEVADQVCAQGRGPRHAALEERESQRGEPVHHAAEEQRTAQCLAGGREGAHVVGDIARGGDAAAPAHSRRVECRSDVEVDEALPQHVVVVHAVEAQRVDPARAARHAFPGKWPLHQAGAHDSTQAEILHRVVEHGDRFLRREGRHDGDGFEAITVR